MEAFVKGNDQQTRDLVGAMEVHTLVQSKTTELKDMQQRFKKLEESLTGIPQQELLSNGKQRVALVTIRKLQKKAEVLHFSIQRRTRDISKVAGMLKPGLLSLFCIGGCF